MRNLTFEKLDDIRTGGGTTQDRRGLSALVNEVYWLALRMLWHPEDAEEATQGIVYAVLDDLRAPRGEVPLRVYVLRGAVSYLLGARPSPYERQGWTFESLARDLSGCVAEPQSGWLLGQRMELVQELQIGCTQAMLLCLEREQRVAYLLSAVFALDDETAALVADAPLALFRERVCRARERVTTFMHAHCGLLNPARPCRCSHRLGKALHTGRVDPRRLLFVLPALSGLAPDAERPREDPARVFREQQLKPAPVELLEGLAWQLQVKLRLHRREPSKPRLGTNGRPGLALLRRVRPRKPH